MVYQYSVAEKRQLFPMTASVLEVPLAQHSWPTRAIVSSRFWFNCDAMRIFRKFYFHLHW